jgi:phosphohistidine phosphatase
VTVRALLVRHGRAEPQAPGGDAARRLTPEGRAAFQATLRHVAGSLRLSRVVTSPLQRARETAALLAELAGARVEEDQRLACGASSGDQLLALARQLGPGVALVGHNPELAEAVARAAGRELEVPPGTLAAVDDEGRLLWLQPGS